MNRQAQVRGNVPEQAQRARELIADAETVVAFTGAGVSTASGVPDFRGPDGLWTRFDPDEFTYDRFQRDPAGFWELRAKLTRALKLDTVDPNACHTALAQAVQQGRVEAVITQNIDGLHQAAGTPEDQVLEIHGTTRHARCIDCRERVPIDQALDQIDTGTLPPTCQACDGALKPDVVLFGERLPFETLSRAETLASQADVMLVAGSSLRVWPAAGLPHQTLEAGGEVVLVNMEATPLDQRAAAVLRGRVEELVPRLLG